ncbi:hypothetical protein BB559_004202 [Furculomyces boomerangus]|uniref:Trehalase n=2 Tax=Harpellales TaxID=61421 RepID=A0A2T9YG40_9FUNG|nr:hypothetical protein BB559_004202 [Furculomyces boomerangus]PWA00001.1 hypothetical protein BB558_003963 [Smittium angustum]
MEEYDKSYSFLPAPQYYERGVRRFSLLPTTLDPKDSGLAYDMVRRGSSDDRTGTKVQFAVDIERTKREILAQEDTNGDFQITILDSGPKTYRVPTASSGGNKKIEIRGTYMLSNLLQEMALAEDLGHKYVLIDEDRLNENPVDRLLRMIKTLFWDDLTRKMDVKGIERVCLDPKNTDGQSKHMNLIYVPHADEYAWDYYTSMSTSRPDLSLKVIKLPVDITPEYVKSINDRFGILTLAANIGPKGSGEFGPDNRSYDPTPFVVPGGRFNEMYGWDSYFEVLGLLIDEKIELAKGMVDHFVYQIKHYGKILNANRTYYLTRSQPPFLTDMALQVYEKMEKSKENKSWLKTVFQYAIKEYNEVWMSRPRYDPETGLSCYYPTGVGIPPETESTHYDHILLPYAEKLGVSLDDYKRLYQECEINEPELDTYFVHDRAVRESGHDTTYRFENVCANLCTVDLNTLLYKYEIDIAKTINYFDGELANLDGELQVESVWKQYAELRKQRIDKYLWNDSKGMYYDYNLLTKKQETYESVTTIWPLWAECASEEQAKKLVKVVIPKFEEPGGLVSCTKESRGKISKERPSRQWDYPFGWAPHQIMAWRGLRNYGFCSIARRLAYRWLYTVVSSYKDYNGVVPEKFDIVDITHDVDVEYGNVGTDFQMVSRSGFGWMNASFELGLQLLSPMMRRALGALMYPDTFFAKKSFIDDQKQSEETDKLPEPTNNKTQIYSDENSPEIDNIPKVIIEVSKN